MYSEIIYFVKKTAFKKSFWTDGEIWTAIAGGIAAFFWFKYDPEVIIKIREHFGDLLNVISVVFGFALAALLFYIEAAGAWAKNERAVNLATMIVDWHIWTVICLLFLIGNVLAVWGIGRYFPPTNYYFRYLYSFLTFQLLYCGFQILNHALTVWWAFIRRNELTKDDQ